MNRSAILLVLFCAGTIGLASSALGDDPAPPAPASGRHNPALAACKKQADDQKMARGDARREFIKNCMKSAPISPPA
jgi:hypothetical protein